IENVSVSVSGEYVLKRPATLVVDETANAYLSYIGTDNKGYIVKLNSQGEQLWISGGINVGNASDISITYIPEENNLFVHWLHNGTLNLNKLNPEGEFIWSEPLVVDNATDTGHILIYN